MADLPFAPGSSTPAPPAKKLVPMVAEDDGDDTDDDVIDAHKPFLSIPPKPSTSQVDNITWSERTKNAGLAVLAPAARAAIVAALAPGTEPYVTGVK